MSAAEHAAEEARRLRLVLEECDRILADRHADPAKREAARRWKDKLGGLGEPSENAYSAVMQSGPGGTHSRGGGASWASDLRYDGWVD